MTTLRCEELPGRVLRRDQGRLAEPSRDEGSRSSVWSVRPLGDTGPVAEKKFCHKVPYPVFGCSGVDFIVKSDCVGFAKACTKEPGMPRPTGAFSLAS